MVLQSGLYTITTKEKGLPIGNTRSIGSSERKNALSLPLGTEAKVRFYDLGALNV